MSHFENIYSEEDENRLRLFKLINQAVPGDPPIGWEKITFAIGGLTEVGFSKRYPELLLVISSQGRGVIDCSKFELVERDRNTNCEWINPYELWAMGIGLLSDEKIMVSGLHGGGLPLSNKNGDCIQNTSLNWPMNDLIFEPQFKSIYKDSDGKDCFKIFQDYELRAYGFSYDGQYFIVATSSEVNVYRKKGGD